MELPGEYSGSQNGLGDARLRSLALDLLGHNPNGCQSSEYVIAHEFGHCLWGWQWHPQRATTCHMAEAERLVRAGARRRGHVGLTFAAHRSV